MVIYMTKYLKTPHLFISPIQGEFCIQLINENVFKFKFNIAVFRDAICFFYMFHTEFQICQDQSHNLEALSNQMP